jgi:flagellar hook assembly protein FlgD
MTVSGRIVKEITQDEIGELRTGTHKTEYAWDGTDEFGDKLANGVYLYRMSAKKSDGTVFEQIETGADKFLKKGFGKMVLIR